VLRTPWRVVSNGRLARTAQAYIAVERVDVGGGKRYVASVMDVYSNTIQNMANTVFNHCN
jgi:hypothetical protein